ncbi:MAG: glycosyl hydrolase 53 family protein [Erysipelotrichaceae bacterium]|nr:glycosyl hydrolase 53 family protein [Erysipelotrichaceae bacterium]
MKKIIILILMAFMCLCGCSNGTKVSTVTSSDSLYVRKIDTPADFVMGMDASSVIAEENSGVVYYDYDGNEADVFKVLAESGINTIRVRVWNNPYDENGNAYGGGNCDINTALEIGKRATEYGMGLLVDFHYSDFWADPGKQMCPKEWEGMNIEEKADALYQYTYESLNLLKDAKVNVTMVQLGNETNGAMAGEKTWMNIVYYLMTAGSKAVREVYPKADIAVHFANPENYDTILSYASKLEYYNLDYDVIGLSYYPYWHGTLNNLSSLMEELHQTYGKKVMVMETSYAYTIEDTDFNGNTIGEGSAVVKNYPYTVQGQTNSVLDVIETVANIEGGSGVCYWEGTWISVGNDYETNKQKWETYGSGWASSYSASYDPNDAGKYYGGCAVDNQAFFDSTGHPLESLKLFALCKTGNEIEVVADAIEDTNINVDISSAIVLPSTVNAIMNDNSTKEVPVIWDSINEESLKNQGVGTYTINGTADNKEAKCYLSLIYFNFLDNYSFEDDKGGDHTPKGWEVIEYGSASELYVEDKKTDSLTGTKHYHFWSSAPSSINFDLVQNVSSLDAGNYSFEISIMGGDAGTTDVYAFVKINDEIIAKAPMSITSYNDWHTGKIDSFTYDGTSDLTVGIHVSCAGSGAGAWGKIDDAKLNSAE